MNRALLVGMCGLALAVSAHAQVTCPAPPPDSPIAAPALDTVPPGAYTIMTHTGARAEVMANSRIAVVEMNVNDQRVWWAPDTAPGTGRVYYNRRYRADASSPWYWQYSKSIEIMRIGTSSVAVSSVLHSATPRYQDVNDASHPLYKYVMYLVDQPNACDGGVLGVLAVAFSNDGVCWTTPRQARHLGGPSFPCVEGSELVAVETVAAIDSGTKIYLISIEGDVNQLAPHDQMHRTQTYVWTATYSRPTYVQLVNGYGEVTPDGIVSPDAPLGWGDRYKPYNYLMNLDMTYDPATGTIYVGRAYPFPFDRYYALSGNHVPCTWQGTNVGMWDPVRQVDTPVEGCHMSPGVLPNRVQIYKTVIGPLTAIDTLFNTPWTLVGDWGGDVGYSSYALDACWYGSNGQYAPRTDARQQNVGRDYAYVNFVRDPAGNLKLYDGVPYILAADSFKLMKSRGECYITGQERATLMSFPR